MLGAVLRPEQDAFGRLLMDLVSGQEVVEVVERDDGCVFASDGRYYLAPFRRWWPQERRVAVARRRGIVDARVGTVATAAKRGELFDTILLLGNNLGLLAGEVQGRRMLRRLSRLATEQGRILAGSYDPYDGASELARRYQERNRKRGKLGGVERLRVRYRQYATPWYDVLFASRDEVTQLAVGTGWRTARFIEDGPGYVAVLERAYQP